MKTLRKAITKINYFFVCCLILLCVSEAPAAATDISSWRELGRAIEVANSSGSGVITLTDHIIFDDAGDDETLPVIAVPLTIHGHGYKVDAAASSKDERPVFQIKGSDAEVTFEDLTITGGYALFGGGGVSVEEGRVKLAHCQVINNVSELGGGGGIRVRNGGCVSFEDCVIKNNDVLLHKSGGGIFFEGSSEESRLVFKNCTIADNRAQGDGRGGGGIYVRRGNASFDSCELSGNKTTGSGGGFFIMDGKAVFRNSRICDNEAKEGAGLHIVISGVDLTGCMVSNNRTKRGGRGGGIFFSNLPVEDRALRLTETQVLKNTCGYAGGGIHVEMGSSFFSGVTVTQNSATDADAIAGGAFISAPAVFENTTVKGNTAQTAPDLFLSSDFGGVFETLGGNDIGYIEGRFFPSGGQGDKIIRNCD